MQKESLERADTDLQSKQLAWSLKTLYLNSNPACHSSVIAWSHAM